MQNIYLGFQKHQVCYISPHYFIEEARLINKADKRGTHVLNQLSLPLCYFKFHYVLHLPATCKYQK